MTPSGAKSEETPNGGESTRVEVNGVMMTRREWKEFMDECPHERFAHPGVTLMDGSPMSICERCKFIQHEAIAKMIEGENN
jgi:hypothetical protein